MNKDVNKLNFYPMTRRIPFSKDAMIVSVYVATYIGQTILGGDTNFLEVLFLLF